MPNIGCLSLKMKPIAIVIVIATVMLAVANAQTKPAFERATLKRTAAAGSGMSLTLTLVGLRNATVTLKDATLSDCIQFGYGIASREQIVGPDWITSPQVRFEIVGKAAPDTPPETLRLMMQNLLAEKLKLIIHQEKRQQPFLALVVAKDGPKFSSTSAPALPLSKLVPAPEDRESPAQVNGRIVHSAMPMSILATLLSRFERRTILDMTGIQGSFRIVLQWTPDPANGWPLDPDRPAIDNALQEQLGLRLESRIGPVDAVVVDYAETEPTDN